MKAYLASPLFNARERGFNEELERRLAGVLDVFLPQRDGALLTRLVAGGCDVETGRRIVFERDTRAIEEADVVVAVLDGRTVDEGVAFELGFALALGKPCIAFKSDDRAMLPTGDNPMIVCACRVICSTVDELVGHVATTVADLQRTNVAQRVDQQCALAQTGRA